MRNLIKIFNKLSITQRFLASVCFFSLPLGVLFFFNIEQLSEKIAFARAEQAGNRVQLPAARFIVAVGAYRAGGVTQDAAVVSAMKQEVESALRHLEEQRLISGVTFGLTDQMLHDEGLDNLKAGEIRKRWDSLQAASVNPLSRTAAEQYDLLQGDLSALIGHTGDKSNLTLDPEMDSYYLADVTSVVSAQTLNRVGAGMGVFEPVLKTHNLPANFREHAGIEAALMREADMDRITSDIETAVKENAKSERGPSPTLKASLESAATRYKTDAERLLTVLSAIRDGKTVSHQEFHDAAARTSQSALELREAASTELDGILKMRIEGFGKYRTKLVLGTFVSLGFALFVLFLTLRGVTRPLAAAVAHVEYVALGDLSRTLPSDYLTRGDEIGTLARAMGEMSKGLRAMIGEITGGVEVLSSAAGLLQSSSTQMRSESENASQKAHSVAAAAEEMSSNVTSVAIGMEETTTNLSNVAVATDQMTATIGEIAGNSEKARRITHEATVQARRITEQINQLSDSAREIGKVTETINEISSQTNLLALNATIEAARAGAAGKGFAVVANEIKALAQQTAAATEDIKGRIIGVQKSTTSGITEIEKVSHVIHEVSDIVSSIAAAIEQQAAATKDIARNIAEASIGVNDANERVAQSSQVSKEIARDISSVDHAASEMAQGSGHVRSSAEEVARISGQLRQTVDAFRV